MDLVIAATANIYGVPLVTQEQWRDFFYRDCDEFANSGMPAGMKMFVDQMVSSVDAATSTRSVRRKAK